MKRLRITDPEAFFEIAKDSDHVIRVVRVYTYVGGPAVRGDYEVGPVNTEQGPVIYAFSEVIPVEEHSGILRTGGTLWRQMQNAKLKIYLEPMRSGAL